MAEKESELVFDDALELYREFRGESRRKGLDLKEKDGDSEYGRDYDFYDELHDQLGCGDQSIAEYLKNNDVSAGRFFRNFLEVIAPFAEMYADIWRFLAAAESTNMTEDVRIRFGDDDDDFTDIDLDEFRKQVRTAHQISRQVTVSYWSDKAIYELFELAKRVNPDSSIDTGYSRGEPYQLPHIESSGNDEFERILERIRDLFQGEIDEKADDVPQPGIDDTDYYNTSSPQINLSDLLPAWEPIFHTYGQVGQSGREEFVEYFKQHIQPELTTEEMIESVTVEWLIDILQMPFWEYRWHTYEIWMNVQTIKALEEYRPKLLIEDGRIPIDGGDQSVTAKLEAVREPEAYVVSELETDFRGDDKERIRPDMSICKLERGDGDSGTVTADTFDRNSRVLVSEYKQHRKLSKSHAEDRAKWYTEGAPESVGFVLTNYDDSVDVDFPDDGTLLGNVRPNTENIETYRNVIAKKLGEVDYFETARDWTLLLDVSNSMSGVYDIKEVWEPLADLAGIFDTYSFTNELTSPASVSPKDIRDGLETTNGTDVERSVRELRANHETENNLLLLTDEKDISNCDWPEFRRVSPIFDQVESFNELLSDHDHITLHCLTFD